MEWKVYQSCRKYTSFKSKHTYPTNKALRVPEAVQGRYVIFQDGTGTATTLGGKQVKVIFTAVCFPIFLMKTFF